MEESGKEGEDRTAQWAVAQLKELHPAFFANLQATYGAARRADGEVEVSTG
jgi:hypothetical protein